MLVVSNETADAALSPNKWFDGVYLLLRDAACCAVIYDRHLKISVSLRIYRESFEPSGGHRSYEP